MFSSALTALLLGAVLSVHAAPLNPRLVTLDPAATAEAQQRDNGATRALTATTIKTADGRCLNVVSGSGDFRDNLTPVTAVACDGSKGQQWDVITSGKHNNVAGQALIVSSLTNACLNFDPRRAAGNQVLLFSCGGRADGEGLVTDSQLFAFDAAKTAGVPLVPQNGKGAVVLTVNNGALDQAAGASAQANGQELFTFGNAAAAPAPAPAPPANDPKPTPAPSATTPPPANTAVAGADQAVSRAGGKLDPTAAAEANVRDAGATRALSDTTIVTADGACLSVDAFAGDFRQNLIPVKATPCDGSAGQKWDVITAGKHNNMQGQALLVSTLTQGCLNFDPRRAAGDQVILFSCGGRADGEGLVTDSQLFAFDAAKTAGVPLVPQNGKGAVVLAANNGALDQAAGSPASASGNQLFSFGGAAAGGAPAPAPAPAPTAAEPAAPAPPAATQAPSTTVPAPATNADQAVSRAGGKLDPTAAAEANVRDAGATRALSGTAIKTADGRCLSVDAFAGDFRQNLIPVQAKACDGSAGQKWDVITSGKHNDVAGQALLVSTLTQGCLNFDPRRAAGDQVLLFSCGGRADGDGKVTDSQLFAFDASKTAGVPLVPQNGKGAVVLAVNNGALDQAAASPAAAAGNQLFTFA